MPQLKKISHISGNILPKPNIHIQDVFASYPGEEIVLPSSYLSIFVDGDGNQVLTSEAESDTSEMSQNRPRKRQRLDHLSQEEKIMRRKLKNRVAAQTARDRKKARMVELEELVTELEREKKILLLANMELQNHNQSLEKENAELKLRLEGKITEKSVEKIKQETEVNESESRLSDKSVSFEHAEGTGHADPYSLDDAIRLLTCNSEADDLLALLQQCGEDLMQCDINSTIPSNGETRKQSQAVEMVGTTSESLESHKELIHFDHIYYKQEEVVSSSIDADLSLPESELSTKEKCSANISISEQECVVEDAASIPAIYITQSKEFDSPSDALQFTYSAFNDNIVCSKIRNCPSPSSSSDAGYDSSFSISSPCSAGNSWDETLTELFPSLV